MASIVSLATDQALTGDIVPPADRAAAPAPLPARGPGADAAGDDAPQSEPACPQTSSSSNASPAEKLPNLASANDNRSSAAASPPPLPPSATPPPLPAGAHTPPAPPVAAQPLDDELPAGLGIWSHMPSWLASMVFHLGVLLFLATYTVFDPLALTSGSGGDVEAVAQTGTFGATSESLEPLEPLENIMERPPETVPDVAIDKLMTAPQLVEFSAPGVDAGIVPAMPAIDVPFGVGGPGPGGAPGDGAGDLLQGIGDSVGSSLMNRLNAGNRARMVAIGGGTPASETAVDRALKWLAEHQMSDGSWNFNHRAAPNCHGKCHDPGHQAQAKIAATALGLLPFLGTGQTHRQGKYKKTIERGLYFLVSSTHVEGDRAALLEAGGRMYGHGLASIVLCEAYGMTHDQWLERPAQMAVNFIVAAQDPVGGGWRYMPLQAGDTSVVGWQVMALKSANMAYLKVPPDTIRKASYFLDSVQTEGGAYYGYTSPGNSPSLTAIGLLCRMYTGWEREKPALLQGIEALSQLGPSLDTTGPPRNNLYYDYYATQVMHHYGGPDWQRWNVAMRDYLVYTQSTKGHEKGSWFFEGSDHGFAAGGRLYCTAMATMILEVYYRHMPLYTDLTTKDKFQN